MLVLVEPGVRVGYAAVGTSEAIGFHAPEAPPSTKTAWGLWKQFIVTLAVYLFVTQVLLVMSLYEVKATPADELQDAATVLFPHLSSSPARTFQSPYSVKERPDIKSFMFDLGGSTCACTLQWDTNQYWQRVWYGQKFVAAHVQTAFAGPLFVPRWQWIVLHKVLNEVLEELATPIFAEFAACEEPMAMETRYDTLVNDLVFDGIVFIFLCCHLRYVIDLPDIFEGTLQYDVGSLYVVLVAFFQFYTLMQVIVLWKPFNFHNVKVHVFGLSMFVGSVIGLAAQIAYLRLLWLMRAWPTDKWWKVSFCLLLLWSPFTFFKSRATYHEQIAAVLAFSLTGFAISGYQYVYTSKNRSIMLFASVWYVGAFVFYVSMTGGNPVITPPVDKFYSVRKNCGISESPLSDSCLSIIRPE